MSLEGPESLVQAERTIPLPSVNSLQGPLCDAISCSCIRAMMQESAYSDDAKTYVALLSETKHPLRVDVLQGHIFYKAK